MSSYILITRPLHEARILAATLESKGYKPFIEPMLTIEPLDLPLPDLSHYQALIFTSANAARIISKQITQRDSPVYCVGTQTEKTAYSCGWENIKSANGDAKALAALLEKEELNPALPLLHLAGQESTGPLAITGLTIDKKAIYKAEQTLELSPECLEFLAQKAFTAALFFSARTAQAFTATLEKHKRTEDIASIKALCLSDSVLMSLTQWPWLDMQTAKRPDTEALIDLLASLKIREN